MTPPSKPLGKKPYAGIKRPIEIVLSDRNTSPNPRGPRNVRNFWLETTVDGYTATVSHGPKSHDGGFLCTISQRVDGELRKAATIAGFSDTNGNLTIRIEDGAGHALAIMTTRVTIADQIKKLADTLEATQGRKAACFILERALKRLRSTKYCVIPATTPSTC